ncbi:MAG: tyrosine-type recombinase/integrase [Chitinophagales bacterium]
MTALSRPDIQSFLDYLKYEKRYSAHTIISYETDLRNFSEYLDRRYGKIELKQMSHAIIRGWLAGLKDKGLTSKSLNRKISALRSFFKYKLRTGKLEVSPMVNVIAPKNAKRLPVFMQEQETKELIKSLSDSTDDWKTLNAKMLIVLLYSTGMRISELINLREQQLDFGRSQIKVLGKGNKERIIPVSRELIKNIEDYRRLKRKEFVHKDSFGEKSGEVLLVTEKGKRIYPKYAYLLVKKHLGDSSTLDKKSPHVLRHTFATHLMNGGADLNAVKELLGHSSLASTQVYTHNSIEKLKNVYKKTHPKA